MDKNIILNNKIRGFTLLEVIIALFLFGMVVLGIFEIFNRTQAIGQHNYMKRQALELANSYLEVHSFAGPLVEIESTISGMSLSPNIILQGGERKVQVIVSWSDMLNKKSQIELTRNYYYKVN